ncbi:MAG: tRNA uridine-5-carboxymethylaminomethyl(34) synthesis GTPase MnmE [Thermoanaerobaculia bacterium]
MAPLVADGAGAADVLVARATPPGPGALAIVRLSGPPGATLSIARALAPRLPARPEARRAYLSPFRDEEGALLDEGLVLFFAAPRSSTGEEVVELQAHGASAIAEGLVAAAVALGARRARPGEFTRRALANGRIDLVRAEGIGRLSAAASRGEARRALGLVRGELSERVEALREELLSVLADLEAPLDFAEDVEAGGEGAVLVRARWLREELARLGGIVGAGRGDGGLPTVVLVGAPNAGKSTLFNALVGEDRALVTETPGTTRDAVSEVVELGGERVRLVDTAGLRQVEELVERLGVETARRAAASADLLLFARAPDASPGEEERLPEGVPVLLVATKADLGAACEEGALPVSARTGRGLETLREEISRRLGAGPEAGVWGELPRQGEALRRAAEALRPLSEELPEELAAVGVRAALHALGEITGETATEELLERIFERFCVGK